MSEATSGLQEIIEVPGVNSLEARANAMPTYLGLGPPDLCRLTKCISDIGLYIQLISRQEGVGFLASSAFKIESGVYCSWDVFHQCDVRVEVRPGGYPAVRAFMVDCDGNTVEEIGRSSWEGVQLSAWLRSIKPPIVPGLVVGGVCPIRGVPANSEMLRDFITLASKFITASSSFAGPSGSLSPTDIYAHEEEGDVGRLGTTIVTEVIADGLIRSRRLRLCPEVFNSLQSAVPHVMIHIARSYRRMGRLDACMSALARCLHEIPADGHVLHYQAKTLLAIPDDPAAWELAITAARLATESIPMDPKVWATLAEAYRRTLNFEQALMALNNFPTSEGAEVPWTGDESIPWSLGIPDVSQCQQTIPDKKHAGGNDPVVGYLCLDPIRQTPAYEMLPKLQQRGLDENDRIVLGRGVGFNSHLDEGQFVSAFEGDTAAQGSTGQMTEYEARIYSVLVGICQDIGWDFLIVARSRVFIMDDDGAEGTEGVDLREVYRQRQQRLSSRPRTVSDSQVGDAAPASRARAFRKRLCSKTLERLFRQLFVDLNQSIKWQQEVADGQVPRKSCDMWCYLAGLAERLQSGDATLELACRMIQAHGCCPRASAMLLRLYTRRRMTGPAIAQALGMVRVFQYRAGGQAPVPLWLLDQVADLVYTVGLSVVRQELLALRSERTELREDEKGLERVLEELVNMEIDGIER
ncbi:hypothetical protein FOZ62_008366 [Perkinsus olseni]|uniref:Uncharacterized protein n=1 Tax=Perkinsus olseni TaxID=32597 RepID=A0A7J6RT96_PEROL|nr:hypothetical protein FOZ62_008366 [Perkinsus olseni]